MKLIGAAIALLAFTTVVSSIPLYNISHSSNESSTSPEYIPSSTSPGYIPFGSIPTDRFIDDLSPLSSHSYDDLEPTSTTWDSPPTGAVDASYCVGFTITSQTEADISWIEYSSQEVVFDFGTSKIYLVNHVDLVRFEDGSVVSEFAYGPWYRENPRTGLHEIHLHRGDTGYYQFLVVAATEDDHHCKYFSSKFKVSGDDHNGSHHSPAGQLQAPPTNTTIAGSYLGFSNASSSSSGDPTATSSSYSADATATISDTDSLVAVFDSILEKLKKIADDGDSSWKSHIKKIEDGFEELKHDIEIGKTSGDDWINDVEQLEKDLDIIKTHGSGTWTDHIVDLEHVLDKLKHGAWDDTYDDKVKAWETKHDTKDANLTSDQELAGILGELDSDGPTPTPSSTYASYSLSSSGQEPTTTLPPPPVLYESPPSSPTEVLHEDHFETGYTEPTPSYYEP